MRSSKERIGAVFLAWHSALGSQSFDSAGVLKRIAGGALRDPKVRALSDAIRALYPRSTPNAKKIGRWLAAHRGCEWHGLRLHGEHDTDSKAWKAWSIQPVPTKAELRAEASAMVEAALAANEAAAEKATRRMRPGLARDLRALEVIEARRDRKAAELATENAKAEQREESKR